MKKDFEDDSESPYFQWQITPKPKKFLDKEIEEAKDNFGKWKELANRVKHKIYRYAFPDYLDGRTYYYIGTAYNVDEADAWHRSLHERNPYLREALKRYEDVKVEVLGEMGWYDVMIEEAAEMMRRKPHLLNMPIDRADVGFHR